jgi:hypothetical protein
MARPDVTGRRVLGDESNEDKPIVVNMKQAHALLSCGHDQIYDLIKLGDLESFMLGSRRKITMSSIERVIAKRLAATNGKFERRSNHPPIKRNAA